MANDQETVRTLYKKLLSFYPRAFRERLGESMGQTFNDLCNERKQQTEQGWFGFVLWVFVETAIGIIKEQALLIKQGDTMKTITTNPRSAAIISFILALPLAILFPIAVFEIEPFNGFYKTLFTEANGYRATALGLTVEGIAMLLLPVAFIVNLVPIVRNVRTGNSVMANPINLLLAVALLFFIAMTWGWALIDQIPCFMGVPNCD